MLLSYEGKTGIEQRPPGRPEGKLVNGKYRFRNCISVQASGMAASISTPILVERDSDLFATIAAEISMSVKMLA